jgi:hypothetical protein
MATPGNPYDSIAESLMELTYIHVLFYNTCGISLGADCVHIKLSESYFLLRLKLRLGKLRVERIIALRIDKALGTMEVEPGSEVPVHKAEKHARNQAHQGVVERRRCHRVRGREAEEHRHARPPERPPSSDPNPVLAQREWPRHKMVIKQMTAQKHNRVRTICSNSRHGSDRRKRHTAPQRRQSANKRHYHRHNRRIDWRPLLLCQVHQPPVPRQRHIPSHRISLQTGTISHVTLKSYQKSEKSMDR